MRARRAVVMVVLGLGAAFLAAKAFARPASAGLLSVGGSDVVPPADIKAQVREYIAQIDASTYGGWFAYNGIINHADIMALFQIESAFDPLALRENDGGAGNHAYGLGQMLETTADDMGISNPSELFDVGTSVAATMKYLKFIYDYLVSRVSGNLTSSQWIGAYNIGIGNVVAGNLPAGYLTKHAAAKLLIG